MRGRQTGRRRPQACHRPAHSRSPLPAHFPYMASQTRKAPHRLRILIVGGSIAGIACAYTLAKAGHEVVVFERSDGTRRVRVLVKVGHRLSMLTRLMDQCPSVARCPPNMARILESWGVPLEKIAEMGGRTDKAVFKHGAPRLCNLPARSNALPLAMTDETLNLVQFRGPALDDLGAPFLFLPHGDLHIILLDLAKAQGAQIRYSAEVAHVDPQRPSVHLASGEAVSSHLGLCYGMLSHPQWLGDLIIGADGYDSVVRRVVTGEELKLDAPQRASIKYVLALLMSQPYRSN
jgi:salicylate hydroxylase